MNFSRSTLFAIATLLATTGSVALAPKTVRDGIEAWQRADYAAAVAIWRPLAEKGDADAAFNLGQAYLLGRGVTVDLAAAQSWLGKAARAGHLDAQTTLGLLLFDSGSRDAALQWLKKAAERGEPRAMLVYGTALFNGDGVPRDPVMAYAYVSRSAAQGLEPAKTTLADMDNILPVDVRRKGVAIALSKAKGKPVPAPRPAKNKTAEVAAAAPAPAASGSWRIQLGAFSQRSSAEALYRKLAASAPVAGHPAVYTKAGAVIRLQVGGFASKAAAASACSALSAKGQACFPVPGK
jgi:TPR repeat protein